MALEAWAGRHGAPKKVLGKETEQVLSAPPLPRLEMTERPSPQFVWPLLERRGAQGEFGKSRWVALAC